MGELKVIVSAGDPGGIGPELTVRSIAQLSPHGLAQFVVAGDPAQLERIARDLELPAPTVVAAVDASTVPAGRPSPEGGAAAVAAVRRAVEMVTRREADALVTGPISKAALQLAGYSWQGQTEMLADLIGATDLRVMLVARVLRVVHVSAHCSLRQALDAVTPERVLRTVRLADDIGRRMLGRAPRIAVAGLNPHAGEGGILGSEEEELIGPAVAMARDAGIDVIGPVSADSLFPQAAKGSVDVVVAMYHDQGHIPVKLLAPEGAVAITLGLPFVRTSPDHGAAFDMVGTGRATWSSMTSALRLAAEIAARDTGRVTV